MHLPDPQAVTDLMAEAASIEILPRFQNLAEGDVREKSPGEIVTAADEAMERRLEPALLALLPGSVVVGEEGAAANAALLDLLAGDAPVWLVDPLDGTAAFSEGRPVFGVMVALVQSGETVASWIHLPVPGETLIAERGGGAYLNGERLRLGDPRQPLRAAISTKFFPPELQPAAETLREKYEPARLWHCAARTYRDLSAGELEVAMFYRLMPWDHAPGVLIHAEAGGFASRFNGLPYSVAAHTGGLMLAPNEGIWREAAPLFEAAS